MLPDSIQKFIDFFSALPSIGPRQATRLAFYIINQGKAKIAELANAISELKNLKTCPNCFNVIDAPQSFARAAKSPAEQPSVSKNLCDICSNPQRRKDIIAIVEKETDIISLERTKKFSGRYLAIGELKKDEILESVQKLRLNNLKSFIEKELPSGRAEEIIIAVNPTTYGDLSAAIIAQELKGFAKKITRLGRGIPTGGEIEFADEETLREALEKRS